MGTEPRLPVVWRPRRGRIVAYTMMAVVLAGALLLILVLPEPFGLADKLGFAAFGFFIAAILHLLARCRVIADEKGITVVNAARTHRYDWAEVLRVNMGRGASWPFLDLADGTSVGAMGIQSADGERAERAVSELRDMLHRYGEAAEPG